MFVKRLIALGKIGVLLLLVSNLAVAKPAMTVAPQEDSKEASLFKAGHSFTKDLLQPHGLSTAAAASEHAAKPLPFGYATLAYDESTRLVLGYVGTTTVILQDANRCESVSRLLFPYHIFW